MKNKSFKFNVWDLAKDFQTKNPNLKYCIDTKCFYIYNEVLKVWESCSSEVLKSQLLTFIVETYPNYRDFNPKNVDGVLILLQRKKFSMADARSEANSRGILLSFQNKVLNCKTGETYPHKAELYLTHTIQCNYDPKASILNTPMQTFLVTISNNDRKVLEVIRACLYLILTNDLSYQVALYIYGPGGTGKSTFTNLLCHLLGPASSLNTSLKNLQGRFGLAPLRDKLLLILSELPLNLGSEPSLLKSIIGGDMLTSEQKYKDPSQILPNSFVIITSNSLWNLVNSSSGMSRRFIYLLFSNKPAKAEKNLNLFNLGPENSASGLLVSFYPHLINWILSIDPSKLEILGKGGEHTTSLLNPDTLILTNPIKAWALERLAPMPGSSLKIGLQTLDSSSLYWNFINWSKQFQGDIGAIKPNQFTSLLLSNLLGMDWSVEKGRSASGYIIKGIQFKAENALIAEPAVTPITQEDFN